MSVIDKGVNNSEATNRLGVPNIQNITYRRKISAVSTSTRGDDASPRNCYSRNNVNPSRRRITDEIDGAAMSTTGTTPVEQRAAEIRRLNHRNETEQFVNDAQKEALSVQPATFEKKKSSSSLASVFRSRASSPIEKMRKFIGRSSSKQAKEQKEVISLPTAREKLLSDELNDTRNQLAQLRITLNEKEASAITIISSFQQCDPVEVKNKSIMTDSENKDTQNNYNEENVDPDVICLDNNGSATIHKLEQEVAALKKENAEKTEEFRQTRKDFILILKEAVLRKNQAEEKLKAVSANVMDDEDWASLTSEHRRILRRNVLLAWAQKVLESYSDHLTVSNFSSDWTDCRAFCALLHAVLPELFDEVDIACLFEDDCVPVCRQLFEELQLPFDATALGLEASDSSREEVSSTAGMADWRYVMNTVFEIYKRGVLRK